MPTWTQKGFAVISDTDGGPPMLHAWFPTRWEAEADCGQAAAFPERLRRNLRAVPATIAIDDN